MKNNFNIITGAIAGFLLIIYFSLVYSFTVNIPIIDDYYAIQDFLLNYIQADSFKEKLCLLLSQFGEHRILFARLTTLIVYAFSDNISYSILIFIGNILMLCIGFIMYKTSAKKDFIGAYILLIILIFFNGQNFETSTWAMVSIANVGVLFAAMASIFCMLNTNRKLQYCGLLLSILTIFSNGNGMFIIPPIAIGLFLQRRKKIFITFICIALISVFLYFYSYTATSRINFEFIYLIKKVHILFYYTCIFTGLNFWVPSYQLFSFFVGLFCISTYMYGIWKKWYKQDLLIYAFLTFYFLSAAAVALLWLNNGIDGALRYRVYCSPIIILTLFLIINNIIKINYRYIYALLSFFVLFSLSSTFIYAHKEQKRFEWKKKSAYNWHHKGTGLATFAAHSEDDFLREAEKAGIYRMPKYSLSEYASSISNDERSTFNETKEITYKIENLSDSGDFIIIEGWGFLNDKPMNFKNIFVRLTNNEHSFIACTYNERRYDLNIDVPLDRIENCGFFAVIDKNLIPPGTYQISIIIRSVFGYGNYYIRKTEENITIHKPIR